MSSLGKKFLSAFIEVSDNTEIKKTTLSRAVAQPSAMAGNQQFANADNKFTEYFTRLFAETSQSGPGYYEFSKMTEAMEGINDEKARYCAAFAGLHVQGVDRQKLLSSAQKYLQLLDADAAAFHSTIDATVREKVTTKKEAIDAAKNEMQILSQQILNLQDKIAALTAEIAENEAKIGNNSNGYNSALQSLKAKLLQDIEKINQHIL